MYNLEFIPRPGMGDDRETQLARLRDFMVADRDEEAAMRARIYYGENLPIGSVSEESVQYFVGQAVARNMDIAETPGDFWLKQGKEIPKVEQQADLFEMMGCEMMQDTRTLWDKEHSKTQTIIEDTSSQTLDERIEKSAKKNILPGVFYTILATIGGIALLALIHYLWNTKKNYPPQQCQNKALAQASTTMKHILRPFPLIISALLVLAICPLPYGYYQFLRIATTIWGITSLCVTCDQSPKNPNFSLIAIISGSIAILYNPLIPVHLTKDIWTILNLGSIPCILLSTYLTHSHRAED